MWTTCAPFPTGGRSGCGAACRICPRNGSKPHSRVSRATSWCSDLRISVRHSTIYRYEDEVHPEPHTFRLRPRNDGTQHLLSYELEICPAPAGSAECLDQDGNVVR